MHGEPRILSLLLDGRSEAGLGGRATVVDPYRGVPFEEATLASAEQLDRAVAGAARAFESLRRTVTANDRAGWLLGMSERIAARKEALARLIALEVGKPLKAARVEVDRAATTFRIASEEARRLGGESIPFDAVPGGAGLTGYTTRRPRGVVLAITPFNFPLNLLAHKVAPALASGNTVVAKPAPQAPGTALALAEIALDAGVPPGAFNVVMASNELAPRLLAHGDTKMVSFTGSVPVGKRILAESGLRKVVLELGSNSPNIVAASADLEQAVPALVAGGFSYAGQVCISVQRIYAHRSRMDELRRRLVEATQKLVLGDPLDEATDVGPMVSRKEAERAEQWIAEAVAAGAELATGGQREGSMVSPAILVEPPDDARCVAEEAFAPLVTLQAYDDLESVVERANGSRFGLNAAIFTNDLKEAFYAAEHLEAGTVLVNQSSAYRADHMPYGGVKESGLGREGVKYAIEDMTELKLAVFKPGG